MIKKLITHGNSAALIIDKPILDILRVDMCTPLEITTDGESLIISPVKEKSREKRFREALMNVNKRHGRTLKKLAG
ncbi:MAG: AbrB/MazE/SpoVT family DNA-binding domain-containing protein [Nitrospirae bacterium]|nr:AbrB/MazE/SpoVT family DNA-binding domain-containing protein [Nitrospirota bacterium]